MKIRKTSNPDQDNCDHVFMPLREEYEKTLLGYYKDEKDFKEGEMFKIYFCTKCSRIVTVDFNIKDDNPVKEFESEYKVVKKRKIER